MKWTLSAAVAAMFLAAPAYAQTIPMDAATCPFETLMADEALAAGLEDIDGKYGLSKKAEGVVSTVVGLCAGTNGWNEETTRFSQELVTTAFIVTELEDALAAAGITVSDYSQFVDDLSEADLRKFVSDPAKTDVAAKAKAKLASETGADIAAANSEMLVQFLQGDARGSLMAMQIMTDGLE
jgi:hypothetical protein